MADCNHPLSALKPESAKIAKNGTVTVRFTSSACLAHATKEFSQFIPEPVRAVEKHHPWDYQQSF
jgi:hypothetical protein